MSATSTAATGLLLAALCAAAAAQAARPADAGAAPAASVALPAAPAPADLSFREFFRMPVGPRGLEPSARLLALDGQRVRIAGYMARQEAPPAGMFILAPLPVALGDEDDSLADDLPANSVFVHLPAGAAVPYRAGLMRLVGTLRLGPQQEADGHVSTVRLELDAQAPAPPAAAPGTRAAVPS